MPDICAEAQCNKRKESNLGTKTIGLSSEKKKNLAGVLGEFVTIPEIAEKPSPESPEKPRKRGSYLEHQ